MFKHNFYEILNAQPTSTFEEIKSNYKTLILQYHPDKLSQSNSDTKYNTTEENLEIKFGADISTHSDCKFVAINEAWNTLKDPTKRKLYDAELLRLKFDASTNVFERLKLVDMIRHAGDENEIETEAMPYYTYTCRCGGQYIIDESALNEISNRNENYDNDHAGNSTDCSSNEYIVECSQCSLVILLRKS